MGTVNCTDPECERMKMKSTVDGNRSNDQDIDGRTEKLTSDKWRSWTHSSYLCRTMVGRGPRISVGGSSHHDVDVVLNQNCEHGSMKFGRVWVSEKDRSRIRKKRGNEMFKRIYGDKEIVLHAARTNTWKEERKRGTNLRRFGYETGKVKSYGKDRTQYVLRRKKVGEQLGEQSNVCTENYEVVNVMGETRNSKRRVETVEVSGTEEGRTSRERKQRRRTKRVNTMENVKKRRNRRLVSLEQFELFNGDGKSMKPSTRGGWAPKAGTEEEKFNRSMNICGSFLFQMQERWKDIPFIRCNGGRRRNQRFICMTNVRMKRNLFGGGCRHSVICSMVVEEQSRKVRALNIRIERDLDDSGNVLRERTNVICSFDIHRHGGHTADSECWHINLLRGNAEMLTKILSAVKLGFVEDHFAYFGDYLCMEESDENGTFKYNDDGSRGGLQDQETPVIAIQLDEYRKEDLLNRNNLVAKRWSAWLCIDPSERLLVPVVWRPVNSGNAATRMICTVCRATGKMRKKRYI